MIKVLVVDDSPLIRALLTEILSQAHDIEVVGGAEDPFEARDLIKKLNPDVLTLDVEMPKMDGVSFLKNLMRLRPMPVIMISTLTQQGAPITLEALEIGAIDFIAKPTKNVASQMQVYADDLIEKVRGAALAKVRTFKSKPMTAASVNQVPLNTNQLIAIGASTGGTEAIKEVLLRLPKNFPPVVITQHIPPVFSASFAERMDRTCELTVKEAEHGEKLNPSTVYIAPGDYHFSIVKKAGILHCHLDQNAPVNRHRPAVDVLFNSIAHLKVANVTAALLTGMGADGAHGLLKLKQAGAYTLAQDEASSVVWGMPKAAIELDAHHQIVALEKVAENLALQVAKNK